jgi:S1-C subfamily serine protease
MTQQPYYVLEIRYPDRPAQTLSLANPRVVIGRDGGDIVTHDAQASAMHAEIEFSNGQIVVRDLGSSNGTWKGTQALPQFAVSAGQEFRCGNTVFKITHIVGGQQLQGGGTVMGDAAMLDELKRQRAGLAAAAAGVPAAAAAPPAKSGPNVGLIAGVGAGLLLLGGLGIAGYISLSSKAEEAEAVAKAAAEEVHEIEESKAAEPKPAPDPTEDEPVVEKDLGELYKMVGAATVVIRVPGSVGSGSIIDAKGVVLTNHHVIDGGERDGLRIKAHVTLGKHNDESQAFEPSGEPLDAWVLAIDEHHDLALLQLDKPPKGLTSLALSAKKPYPGMKVAAVGHAGAGMLWAIKGGEISSTGKLAGHTDMALGEAEGFEKEMLAKLKAQMDKKGRVIQSTAKILPGDSGGPLVALDGSIVGVNAFGRIDRATNQWLSFHVHLAEVQAFTKTIPDHPLDFIPDPWQLEEAQVRFGDADIDGIDETLVIDGGLSGKLVTLLDLDQNSLTKGQTPPTWEELTKDPAKRPFDAELAVISDRGKKHFLYDTDGDGHFDVYMFDNLGAGQVTDAYRVPKGGSAKKDASVQVEDGLDAKLFTDAGLRARFGRVGPVVFPGAVEREGGESIPEPLGATDTLTAADHDGDGTHDTFTETTIFHQRVVWDANQSGGASDAEAVAVVQGSTAWIWYDTNDDGTLDLLLEGASSHVGTATRAYTVSGSSTRAASGHVGRLLVRPDLLSSREAADRLRRVAGRAAPAEAIAGDEGLGSFPAVAITPTASVLVTTRGELANAVAMVTELSHDIVLVDLDGSSTKSAKDEAEVAKLVRAGEFDAEFAMLTVSGQRWAFYDTDATAGFDLVIVGQSSGDALAAYEIDGGRARDVTAGSKLAQWGRFSGAQATEFEKVAPRLWPAQAGAN